MNYKQSLCASLLSALVSLPAFADLGNLYASGKIGWAWENINPIENTSFYFPTAVPSETKASDNMLTYGGAVGYRFNTFYVPVRIEVDYTNRNNLVYNLNPIAEGFSNVTLKSTLQSQDILGNLIVDIPVVEMFGFFAGGGAGLAFNRTTTTLSDGTVLVDGNTDRNGLAWMVTAGASVLPTHWLAIDVSYRFSSLGAVRWSNNVYELTSNSFSAQEAFLTFRFTLPSRDECCKKAPVPYKPKAMPEPEPIRKPVKKSPEYKPQTKGAHYESKGAHYEGEKGAHYDSSRAKPVKKETKKTESNKKTNYSVD